MNQTTIEQADSINQLALAEDFITVSYIYAEPGTAAYSKCGHSMLRLQSPSNDLDISYAFAIGDDTTDIFTILFKHPSATYIYRPTSEQLQIYASEGRAVKEIQLNLTPRQEQDLWRLLDEEMGSTSMYHYDYWKTNCSNMINAAVRRALGNEQITYKNLSKELSDGSLFRHKLLSLGDTSPWYKVFWNVTLGEWIDTDCPLDTKLIPGHIWEEWQKATIESPDGTERPLTIGKPHTLLEATKKDEPVAVTPDMVGITLLICTCILSALDWRQKRRHQLSKIFDALLLGLQMLTTLWIMISPSITDASDNSWNWMMMVFNPLPLITLAFTKKFPHVRLLFYIYALIPLLFVCASPWIPQMQFYTYFLHLLFIVFSIRCAIYVKMQGQKQ